MKVTPRQLCGKERTRYPFNGWLGGPQRQYGRFGKDKNMLPYRDLIKECLIVEKYFEKYSYGVKLSHESC